MRKSLSLFLVGLFLTLGSAQAATIEFLENPRYTVDDYLVFLLRKIPLQNLEIKPDSNVIQVRGRLFIDLSDIKNEEKRELIALRIKSALAGEVTVAGATFESSEAEITFSDSKIIVPLIDYRWESSLFEGFSGIGKSGTTFPPVLFFDEYFGPARVIDEAPEMDTSSSAKVCLDYLIHAVSNNEVIVHELSKHPATGPFLDRMAPVQFAPLSPEAQEKIRALRETRKRAEALPKTGDPE